MAVELTSNQEILIELRLQTILLAQMAGIDTRDLKQMRADPEMRRSATVGDPLNSTPGYTG